MPHAHLVPGTVLELSEPVQGKDSQGKPVFISRLTVVAELPDGKVHAVSAEEGKHCVVTLQPDPTSTCRITRTDENSWVP